MTATPAAASARLAPGTELTIIKVAPTGEEAARYPGRIIAQSVPPGWIGAHAVWTHGEMMLDGLRLAPGDRLDEYFSVTEWFNAFHVIAPSGEARGWYANVTYPATVRLDLPQPTLTWHDLYVDVIVLPDGTMTVRDEDELACSGMSERHPALYRRIRETRDAIVERARAGLVPFDQPGRQQPLRARSHPAGAHDCHL